MRKLHITLSFIWGLLFFLFSINVNAQIVFTNIVFVSNPTTTACIGDNPLFFVGISPSNITGFTLTDNNEDDGITGTVSCLNPSGCNGTGGTDALVVEINVVSGTIGSPQTFDLTINAPFPILNNSGVPASQDLMGVTFQFTVNVDGLPSVDIMPTDPFICNGNPASLTATVSNGASAASYMWSANGGDANFQGGSPSMTSNAIVVAEDTYNVTVTNACGSGQESIAVGEDVTPVVDLNCQDNGDNTTTVTADILNNASNVTVSFFNDGNLQSSFNNLNGPTSVSETIGSQIYLNQEFTVSASNACGTSSNMQSCEILLPVELKYFQARPKEESVMLEWKTIAELNNDFFTIEKSYNGQDFMAIAEIQGAGTTQEPLSYSFLDENALRTATGTNTLYYRLRQTDFGGATYLYDLVTVAVPNSQLFSIQRLWQQGSDLIVDFSVPTSSEVESRIFSLEGRLLEIRTQEVEAGNIQMSINTSDLAPGMYLFSASNNGRIITEKFIKL
jgi:hypothetical protein